jgi:hypothetical protein
MRNRVDKQAQEIERLEAAGEDTKAAIQKLSLLKREMDEMRLQSLSPTLRDTNRPAPPQASAPRPNRKK